MKDYITVILATVLVVAFLFNVSSILNYAEGVQAPVPVSGESIQVDSDLDYNEDRFLGLNSITQFTNSSGSLSSHNMSFSEPDLLAEENLKEEDNKKIFFFGRVDPNTSEEIVDNTWGEWGEGNSNPSSGDSWVGTGTPTTDGSSDISEPLSEKDLEPIEVTLDRFLDGNSTPDKNNTQDTEEEDGK